jgi:hypothetical protein
MKYARLIDYLTGRPRANGFHVEPNIDEFADEIYEALINKNLVVYVSPGHAPFGHLTDRPDAPFPILLLELEPRQPIGTRQPE